MSQAVITPFLIVLLTAITTLLTRKWKNTRNFLSIAGGALYVAAVADLFFKVMPSETLTYQLSNWPAPYGISFVADPLSGFMLGLTAVVALPTLVYSIFYMDEYSSMLSFQSLFHFMLLGVTGAFLTGDIFNLFVWFEVMLMSSYIMLAFQSTGEQTRAALKYVVVNLIGSAFMLVAIGGIYSTLGTLNMADIASRLAAAPAQGVEAAPVLGLAAILFCVFALKAGIAPFQFWVPSVYRAAPAPVSAFMAGAVKKVGVYAIIRLYFGIFATATVDISLPFISGNGFLDFFAPLLFIMAALSIFLGGIGAVGRDRLDGMLAYSSIGQIGFIILPLAMAAFYPRLEVLAITAALVYSLNHAIDKAMLFLEAGVIEDAVGTLEFDELGGLSSRKLLAASFFIGALSLIGIPPMVGFFGKLLIFKTALAHPAGVTVALGGGILTILYFSRAWNQVFWGKETGFASSRSTRYEMKIVAFMALLLLLAGIGFDPVFEAANHAAEAAVSQQEYINAVLEGGGHK